MARTQGKTRLIITITIVVAAMLVVATVVFAKNNTNKPAATPSVPISQQGTTTNDAAKTDTTTNATTTPATADTTSTAPVPTVDPSTLTSVDIAPLSITVFYTKGVHGFNFAIKKTVDQTQYVDFSSTDLVGTKCTNDEGLFVTIIKNPNSTENQATVSQTVKVGNDTYGLSLAGKGCTANIDLLNQYQTAFINGFASLKAL